MKPSPETAHLPMTALGVPIFEEMRGEQRAAFVKLLNRRRVGPTSAL